MTRRDLFRATVGALCGLVLPWSKPETLLRWDTFDEIETLEWTTSDGARFTADMTRTRPVLFISRDSGRTWSEFKREV